jgi:hypothetical protein
MGWSSNWKEGRKERRKKGRKKEEGGGGGKGKKSKGKEGKIASVDTQHFPLLVWWKIHEAENQKTDYSSDSIALCF